MKRIAIFASGSGTNAENIITYFQKNMKAKVVLVLSNNPKALVLERASKLGVQNRVFNKQQLNDSKWAIENLKNLDLIVLAGFLWKFPEHLLEMYKNKVVNVHPALLPKYGGKGMYGSNIHKAVIKNKELEIISIVNINLFNAGKFFLSSSKPIVYIDVAVIIKIKKFFVLKISLYLLFLIVKLLKRFEVFKTT